MSLDGNWKIVISSPMGPIPVELSFAVDGGRITGTQTGQGQTAEISDGVIDGERISWAHVMSKPAKMTMRFTGTVSGDELAGEVKAGFLGTFGFSGSRVALTNSAAAVPAQDGSITTYQTNYHVAGVCEVAEVRSLTPSMRRITLQGNALEGLEQHWRAEMLVRLYFPPPGQRTPPEPYLTADGSLEIAAPPGTEVSPFSAVAEDPLVRAFTGRHYRPDTGELDVDFVLHEIPGLASEWARHAAKGDRIGVVEFGLPAGHRPASANQADTYLMFADEAALPAAQTNFEAFPPGANVRAFIEVADEHEEQPINSAVEIDVTWLHRGDARPGASGLLVDALRELDWPQGNVFVWACCDIKAATEIRQFITGERGMTRGTFKIQAYWRRGKTEVERMSRMTELSIAEAETDPDAFQESFESIGMNITDPTVFEQE